MGCTWLSEGGEGSTLADGSMALRGWDRLLEVGEGLNLADGSMACIGWGWLLRVGGGLEIGRAGAQDNRQVVVGAARGPAQGCRPRLGTDGGVLQAAASAVTRIREACLLVPALRKTGCCF